MRKGLARVFLVVAICTSVPVDQHAQSARSGKSQSGSQKVQKRDAEQTSQPAQQTSPPAGEEETLKIDTDLVTVPVIATDKNGLYIPNLKQTEFSIAEDNVKQEIAFFATINVPFHVVLMLDTSASTREKLTLIQQAAGAFVEQLQPGDRVKVISFDDAVVDYNDFTSDRALLKAAINKTRPGQGTKLYDAFELALGAIRQVRGRKAIVIFTDGVDYHSDRATFDGTLRGLDEEGVVVYPIRYDTREETERLAREQAAQQAPELPTIGVIRKPPSGTTPPTFPSGDPDTVPTSGRTSRTGPFGLPLPDEIIRRRRESEERDRDRDRNPDGWPRDRQPDASTGGRWPDRRTDPRTNPGRTDPGTGTGRPTRREDDSIDSMLDMLYLKADSYLAALVEKSGGRLLRADTLASLPDAFAQIAGELRTQYSIGYYPSNKTKDDTYRKIKVTSTRKNVIIRARPGYRPPTPG
ncbi:MAG TPA: VWA domain-containing protein [Pyrinomonadaceae bacterium]|nr:VWA domain-containing protein [Pyrinomonadaceae bacterium]